MSKDRKECPAVELKGVNKTYTAPSGVARALADVTCRVASGQLVGVVGKSGSGKSTLLNVIAGIDRPTDGEVWVAGTALHALSEARLAGWRGRSVGVVFQFFQLLPTLTVVENVMLPMDFCNMYPTGDRRKRSLALLDRVGIADQADKFPLALSGGQQQRAAIARALANDPPLLVADEPTGNLDSQTGRSVWRVFQQLAAEGKTVVVVTHDTDVAGLVERVISLSDGAVVSDQSTQSLARLGVIHE